MGEQPDALLGCDVLEPGSATAFDFLCRLNCTIYYGTVKEGLPCLETNDGSFSNCAPGLSCDGGVCEEGIFAAACDPLPAGGMCADGLDQTGLCAPGLFCDFLGAGTCIALPGNGEPCYGGSFCAPGQYCNVTDPMTPICAVAPGLGGDCSVTDDTCSEGTCEGGFCVTEEPLICEVTFT